MRRALLLGGTASLPARSLLFPVWGSAEATFQGRRGKGKKEDRKRSGDTEKDRAEKAGVKKAGGASSNGAGKRKYKYKD